MSEHHDKLSEAASAGRHWQKPDMSVLAADRIPPAPLPEGVFSPPVIDWITDQAQVKSAPPDYIAMALLGAAAACIGTSRRALVQPGWTEPAIMWIGLVGPPSWRKTPALSTAQGPLEEINRALHRRYLEERRAYDAQGDETGEQSKPYRETVFITDITVEQVARRCANQERGLLLIRDELAGFLDQHERYNKGGDRAFYLEGWNGGPYIVDRVKLDGDLIEVRRLHINLLGALQPDALNLRFDRSPNDGFLARFFFVWPEKPPLQRCAIEPDEATPLRAFERLRGLELGEHGATIPIPLTPEAQELFFELRKEFDSLGEAAHGVMASWLGKSAGAAGRVALVLHLLDWAFADEERPPPSEIPLSVLARAGMLVQHYLLPHTERVFGDLAAPPSQRRAATLARLILRAPQTHILPRQLRMKKVPLLGSTPEIREALEFLAEAHWVYKQNSRPECWAVNPRLLAGGESGLDGAGG